MAEPLTGTPAVLSQWLIPEGRWTNLTLLLPTSQELEYILCLDSLSSSLCPGLLITSKDALSKVRGERGRGKGTHPVLGPRAVLNNVKNLLKLLPVLMIRSLSPYRKHSL